MTSKFAACFRSTHKLLHCCVPTGLLQVADIQAVLRDTSHNGYPVVRDSSAGQICLGLVTRGHLLALLQQLIDGYNSHGGTSRGAANGVSSAAAAAPHDGDAGAQAQRRQQQHQQPLLARQVCGAADGLQQAIVCHTFTYPLRNGPGLCLAACCILPSAMHHTFTQQPCS